MIETNEKPVVAKDSGKGVAVVLSKELSDRLDAYHDKTGSAKSKLCREFIDAGLKEAEKELAEFEEFRRMKAASGE